jgi:thymidine kinase
MNAGKSLELISTHHNYIELGKNPVALMPEVFGNRINSRVGCELEAITFDEHYQFLEDGLDILTGCDCILIDEAQVLTKKQVIELHKIAVMQDIPVICYGLRTNFRGEPFEGSIMLLALADELKELPTLCHCGKKARMVLRTINGKVVTEGELIAVKDTNDNIKYHSVCGKHFYLKQPYKDYN